MTALPSIRRTWAPPGRRGREPWFPCGGLGSYLLPGASVSAAGFVFAYLAVGDLASADLAVLLSMGGDAWDRVSSCS